ncbi:MAG: ribokinase [Chloroflexota bacterium]
MVNIVVIGSFVVGLTIRVPRMPVLGENLMGDSFDFGPGGKGTNQAIAAKRLGAEVTLLACLGGDLFADVALDLYQQESLSLDHIHRIAESSTGVGFVTLIPSGDNTIVLDPGANMQMKPDHLNALEPEIAKADIVMCQLEVPLDIVAQAMALGRKHGVTTLLNPAPAQILSPEILQHVDFLTPNESETRILQQLPPDDPTPTAELGERLLDLGVENIIITQGEKGAFIVRPDGGELIPSTSVQAVDVTGAGDSFNAALAVGIGEGLSLHEAVQRANYAGAYTATHLGVIDGLPSREILDEFVKS